MYFELQFNANKLMIIAETIRVGLKKIPPECYKKYFDIINT